MFGVILLTKHISPLKGKSHFGLIKHNTDALCLRKIPGEIAAETRTHVSLGINAGSSWTGLMISKIEAKVKPAAPLGHRNCVAKFLQLKLGGATHCNGSHRARHQKVYTCPLRHETRAIVVTIRLLVVILCCELQKVIGSNHSNLLVSVQMKTQREGRCLCFMLGDAGVWQLSRTSDLFVCSSLEEKTRQTHTAGGRWVAGTKWGEAENASWGRRRVKWRMGRVRWRDRPDPS